MGSSCYEMRGHLEAFRQIAQLPLVFASTACNANANANANARTPGRELNELSLWACVTTAMQEDGPRRAWHVLMIVGLMETLGLRGGGREAVEVARGVVWVDAVDGDGDGEGEGGRAERLCWEIDGYLAARGAAAG